MITLLMLADESWLVTRPKDGESFRLLVTENALHFTSSVNKTRSFSMPSASVDRVMDNLRSAPRAFALVTTASLTPYASPNAPCPAHWHTVR